ncbi:methyltransferase domain-containing protein [Sphingomonas sp. UV9]|uniref:SAM-dependent methyltransferase n=1 Tax=Sphingomonas sp. UV9 TaxID=1851410 RepID=UPI000FFBBA3A|nr:methyltransferase domain-containing protein [Sphingomonas sp. UV9]RXD02133.1 methyltransferase domain-containing protein [Sphingomonas sp. UV9]
MVATPNDLSLVMGGVRNRLKRVAALVALVRFVRAVATPLGRGRLDAGRRGALLFQPATVTRLDRHPVLFALVAARLAEVTAPRLLSFGCSTGEEAVTLARHMPHARIDAIDANPACIAQARRTVARMGPRSTSGRIDFACADTPDALAAEGYDAVFCLSVLRHGDLDVLRPERCTALLPFARFAAAVEALDRCVRPGGLLILWGCHFRFVDTATSAHYRTVATPGAKPQSGPFYGPDDRLLPDDAYAAFVFAKI